MRGRVGLRRPFCLPLLGKSKEEGLGEVLGGKQKLAIDLFMKCPPPPNSEALENDR